MTFFTQPATTCLQALAAFLPSVWLSLIIRQELMLPWAWMPVLPAAVLSAALVHAARMPKENRLPVCTMIVSSLAAGLVWPVAWFVCDAHGLCFLWQFVWLALSCSALVKTERGQIAVRAMLFIACAFGVIVCAGGFALASGMLDSIIPPASG